MIAHKYIVTTLWHDQPEGGSFSTDVIASSEEEALEMAFREQLDSYVCADDFCRICAARYEDGGDGYDGMCPDCADKAEGAEEELDQVDDYGTRVAKEMGWIEVDTVSTIKAHGDVFQMALLGLNQPILKAVSQRVLKDTFGVDYLTTVVEPDLGPLPLSPYFTAENLFGSYLDATEDMGLEAVSDEMETDLEQRVRATIDQWQFDSGLRLGGV